MFLTIISTCLQQFRHLFAVLDLTSLPSIFDRSAYSYHTLTQFEWLNINFSYVSFNYIRQTVTKMINRSNRLHMFFKIGVVKNFAEFTGKDLCWSLFLIKLQAFRSVTLLKGDSNTVASL